MSLSQIPEADTQPGTVGSRSRVHSQEETSERLLAFGHRTFVCDPDFHVYCVFLESPVQPDPMDSCDNVPDNEMVVHPVILLRRNPRQ